MGALRDGVELWMAVRPFHRWKERREAKRAAALAAAAGDTTSLSPTESVAAATVGATSPQAAPAAEDTGMFSELLKSYARSALKVTGTAVATAVVTHGLVDPSNTDALTAALEAIGGGVVTIVGLWWSHRTHAA